ncbi:MAG TPA: ornithine cyclodeaminase family protein, partial [Xanthobacteraceae bacterium]|nr:ornithine cyclodeaminase family protein [Xanthobacteraceae bacterium]
PFLAVGYATNMTLILSNADVDKLLTMPECIAVLEEAYSELAEGRGVSRTRSDCFARTAREDALYSLKSMDGVIPKLGVGAVRINSDIVTWPKKGNNVRREKVPAAPGNRYVGLVLLFSTENGEPLAIFPDGVMQRMRVGAANGLGAKYLARKDSKTVGILGSGWQAGAQLMAVCAVRPVETIRCFSPNPQNRETFAAEMSGLLGVAVTPVASAEEAIKGADIVMCATNTVDPVLFEHWIEPGMHLSSIKRPEIEAKAVKRADRVVIHVNDSKPIHVMTKDLVVPETADGRGWQVAGDIDFEKLPTLPDLITGRVPGRSSGREVTCFINNIGLGYQFAAAGSLLYRKAKESGVGHDLPTDWFTEDVHP